MENYMNEGNKNRSTGATLMNADSSRFFALKKISFNIYFIY